MKIRNVHFHKQGGYSCRYKAENVVELCREFAEVYVCVCFIAHCVVDNIHCSVEYSAQAAEYRRPEYRCDRPICGVLCNRLHRTFYNSVNVHIVGVTEGHSFYLALCRRKIACPCSTHHSPCRSFKGLYRKC